MADDALSNFIQYTRAAFGPLTTELVLSVRAQLEQLTAAPSSERWLQALHQEAPGSKELHRDPTHGFVLLAHSEATDLYRPPHDHGRGWVIYALQRGLFRFTDRDLKKEGREGRLTRYVSRNGIWTTGGAT